MSSNGQPEPKLLSNLWFSLANAIGWSSDHVTRHRYQEIDWVLIVHKGVTRSGNPITWSHVMTASIMLDISVIWKARVLLFSGLSSIWDAKHVAKRTNVNNCPQMPELWPTTMNMSILAPIEIRLHHPINDVWLIIWSVFYWHTLTTDLLLQE